MLAGPSANTHAVCGPCSPFLRFEAQECASTAVVRPHMNECLLSLSANFSLLLDYHVFNENVKSRAAAGGGFVHCLYFARIIGREKED